MGNRRARGTSFFDAFRIADDILRQAARHLRHHYRTGHHHREFLLRCKSDYSWPGLRCDGTAVPLAEPRVDAANRYGQPAA